MSLIYERPFTHLAGSTIQSSTGSTTVTVAGIDTSTAAGDLNIMVGYCGGDPSGIMDAGDGWVIPAIGYDAAGFGLFIALCLAPGGGAGAYSGLILPSSMAWTAKVRGVRLVHNNMSVMKLDLARAIQSGTFWSATASGTANTLNARQGSGYKECIEIVAEGHNNGGTTTLCASPSNYTELIDAGVTSPPHGVDMNYRAHYGAEFYTASVNFALVDAKTNRAVLSCYVPIIAGVTSPQRQCDLRRFG